LISMDNLTKPEEIIASNLTETHRKIFEALSRLNLKDKLDNFLLIEQEKQAREGHVSGYPYWLTIDPANFCSLRCPFCPTGQGRSSRGRGVLSWDNFRKTMDELGTYLLHIDFCNWGEPLLNPDIYRMVKYAKQYNIDTKIDSNLNHLNGKGAEDMVLCGLDKLIVSLDGATQETYSRYRIGGDFDKVMGHLKLLLKKRKDLGSSHPYISWQFLVFRHNEHEIEEVKKIAKDIGVDHVGITKAFIGNKEWIPLNEEYSHYKKDEINNDFTSQHFKPPQDMLCNWPWEAIAINPDGSVSACCSVEDEKDDFGNIFENAFKEIWNNNKYRQARRFIKDKLKPAQEESNICIGCRHSGLINLDILSCHSFFNHQGSI